MLRGASVRVLANLTQEFGDHTVNLAMTHLTVLGGRLGGGEREAQSIMEYSVPAAIFSVGAWAGPVSRQPSGSDASSSGNGRMMAVASIDEASAGCAGPACGEAGSTGLSGTAFPA